MVSGIDEDPYRLILHLDFSFASPSAGGTAYFVLRDQPDLPGKSGAEANLGPLLVQNGSVVVLLCIVRV